MDKDTLQTHTLRRTSSLCPAKGKVVLDCFCVCLKTWHGTWARSVRSSARALSFPPAKVLSLLIV